MKPTDKAAGVAPYSPFELYLRYALAGAQCATIPHTVLVPIDVVKTRLQTHPGIYNGMSDAFRKIVASEGSSALLLGMGPTLVGYAIQGACKFGFYEYFKDKAKVVYGKEYAANNSLWIYMVTASVAETIGTFCLCPWEALRIRMVSQPDFATSTFDGLRKIHAQEGLYGFYKGLAPILLKQVPYTVTQLTVFTKTVDIAYNKVVPGIFGRAKDQLSTTSQLLVSLSCGVIAGVTSAIASHPADTILSRINMIAKTSKGQKQATITGIVREIGFKGLWLGVGTRCFMVGLLSSMMFLIYDSVKVVCGLPTTSGLEQKEKSTTIVQK